MYEYLHGKLAYTDKNLAIIDCGGVGYKCAISQMTHSKIREEKETTLYTYLNVKEDALDLYGFYGKDEREMFLLLISVNGIGPRLALAILSELTVKEISSAILLGDFLTFKRVSGVGAKAEMICLDLKKAVQKTGFEPENDYRITQSSAEIDAVEILVQLGYQRQTAKKAVSRCPADNSQDIVKQALKIIANI